MYKRGVEHMDQRKEINLFEKTDASIIEIQEYHSTILNNHLNPPILSPRSNEVLSTALVTPNYLYEQTMKQLVKNKKQEDITSKNE